MIRIVHTFVFVLLATISSVRADSTEWVEVQGGSVRLITTGPIQDGTYLAGLEFMLEPGWHTYWRYPGEAGIPPQITFTHTENLKDFEILYPVPERYSDGFSESVVYHHGIVLPLKISPEDAAQDVRLDLDIFFGICSDICVPGDATFSLQLSPAAEADNLSAKLIERDLQNVPQPALDDNLQIQTVTLDGANNLVIEARANGTATPELFVAGPEGSYIGLPKLSDHSGEKATWTLSTKGLKASDADNHLRLVLSVDGKAIEHLEPIQPTWLN